MAGEESCGLSEGEEIARGGDEEARRDLELEAYGVSTKQPTDTQSNRDTRTGKTGVSTKG